MPRLKWFRRRQAKHREQEQKLIVRAAQHIPTAPEIRPKPLDRNDNPFATNRHGWIVLPKKPGKP